ncbi:hypothetical protein ZHAS_00014702 [Anopheles sinensis]|uniref:Uncharacterized protein n=1 Tax=Anopheles sinensis TaxID=74873 RepID=A0A084W911_ANOSI|nr:hypothetical protein ZHAS_00014702 [Anopheles sinensis]
MAPREQHFRLCIEPVAMPNLCQLGPVAKIVPRSPRVSRDMSPRRGTDEAVCGCDPTRTSRPMPNPRTQLCVCLWAVPRFRCVPSSESASNLGGRE